VSGDDLLLSLVLPPHAESVTAARRAVRELVGRDPALSERGRFEIELLASELVSNAVEHGCPQDFALRLSQRAVAFRLEVTNAAREFRPPQDRPADDERGRGFPLIRALCSRWGVEPGPDRVTVWVEYPG
jgi:anti-sigma regulatory factor (Ser/Thr protein kinase)